MPDQQTPDSDELEKILRDLKYGANSQMRFKPADGTLLADNYEHEIKNAQAALLAWRDAYAEQKMREALDDFTDNWLGRLIAENSIPNHWIYEAKDKYLAQLTRPEAGGKDGDE